MELSPRETLVIFLQLDLPTKKWKDYFLKIIARCSKTEYENQFLLRRMQFPFTEIDFNIVEKYEQNLKFILFAFSPLYPEVEMILQYLCAEEEKVIEMCF